ncbi:hypothetical protein L9F63_017381, partial [Diploptera punctata]
SGPLGHKTLKFRLYEGYSTLVRFDIAEMLSAFLQNRQTLRRFISLSLEMTNISVFNKTEFAYNSEYEVFPNPVCLLNIMSPKVKIIMPPEGLILGTASNVHCTKGLLLAVSAVEVFT